MKQILRDVWSRDRRGFVNVLILNIAASLSSGISIAMLVPMLGLLDISDGAESALRVFLEPLQSFSVSTQLVVMVTLYFICHWKHVLHNIFASIGVWRYS